MPLRSFITIHPSSPLCNSASRYQNIAKLMTPLSLSLYIYIYIYICREIEREMVDLCKLDKLIRIRVKMDKPTLKTGSIIFCSL